MGFFKELREGLAPQKNSAASTAASVQKTRATQPAQSQRVPKRRLNIGVDGQGVKSATAAIPLPTKFENRHFLIGGTTGAGKTRLFFQLADQARDRGDKALVVDHGCEQIMRNFRPGDIILNPFDGRFPGWNPFAEIDAPWDTENLARFLIPDGVGSGAEWTGYAQALLSSVIRKIVESADMDGMCSTTNDEIIRWACSAKTEDLQRFCEGEPIAALLDPKNDRMCASVRGIVASKMAPFRYLQDGDFSLRDWAADDNDKRWVFISYRDEQFGSLRSLISSWVSLVVMYALGLPENEERRLWLFLDELGSLDKLPALSDALTKIRKRGGVVVAGLQSVSQLEETYGKAGAQTLMANFGTWIALRLGDAETAEQFSRHFGEQEIWQDSYNEGMAHGQQASMNDGVSVQLKKQRVVEYTELMQLDDLQGYIKIPGKIPVGEVTAGILPPPKDRGAVAFLPPKANTKSFFVSRRAREHEKLKEKGYQLG